MSSTNQRPLFVLTVFFLVSALVMHFHFVEWRGDIWNRIVISSADADMKPRTGTLQFFKLWGGPKIFGLWTGPFDCSKYKCPDFKWALHPESETKFGAYVSFDAMFKADVSDEPNFWKIKAAKRRHAALFGFIVPIVLIFAAAFTFSFVRRSRS